VCAGGLGLGLGLARRPMPSRATLGWRWRPTGGVGGVCVGPKPVSLATQGLLPLRWRWDRLLRARVWLCEDCF